MGDLKRLRILRGGMKGSLNKSLKFLDDFLSAATKEQVEGKRLTISKSLATYESYAEQIYGLLSTTDEVEEEMSSDLAYIEEINTSLARLNNGKAKNSGFNLPKLSLPFFYGDPTTWTAFWDIFDCSVHQNRDLTPVQKFTYLRGQLREEALKLVEGYKLENSSYASAVELLKETYGRPELIKAALITKFIELTPPVYEVSELKEFYASFECLLRSMESMNVTREDMCSVAIFNKIPTPLKGILRRSLGDAPLDLESLIRHFRTEVFDMEAYTDNEIHAEVHIPTAAFPVQTPRGDIRTTIPNCKLCGGSHNWYNCPKYPEASQKIGRAKALQICTSCLSKDHAGKTCTNSFVKPCRFCRNKHYFSLCNKPQTSVDSATNQVSAMTVGTKERQLLPTIMLPIVGYQTRYHMTRTLLDQCSQRSFVLRSSLARFRCTSIGQETLRLEGFTGGIESQKYDVVELCYLYRRKEYTLRTVVVDNLPSHYISSEIECHLTALKKKGFKLADPELADNKNNIELLVGADYYYDLVHPGYHREGTLILLPTKQGYAVTGSYAAPSQETQVEVITVLRVAVSPIDKYVLATDPEPSCPNDLNRLWDLDNIGISSHELDKLSKHVLTTYEETVEHDPVNGQYIVRLPWNGNKDKLPSNFGMAMGRLRGLQRQFINNPQYCKDYSDVIAEQERRGFIERINSECGGPVHYLAHHGVKKDSPTTPIRVVYDCSAKTNPRGYSLNDCLHTGPSLVSDLAQILLRFRCGKFAWVADIEKAFLMLQLNSEDRDSTRFLWPRDPMNPESSVVLFRFRVVLFGATCSQFLLNATILRHIAEADLEPDMRREIRQGIYIDNLQGSGDDEDVLLHKYWIMQNVFAKAHLHLREWATNSSLLKRQVTADGVTAQDSIVKFLGLKWDVNQDTLSFSFNPAQQESMTKRYCLSLTAQLFDPLGLLLPVTIRARLFLQQLWRLKLDWDQELPLELQDNWRSIQSDLVTCSKVLLERKAISGRRVDLHAFADASNSAYGTAIYLCNGEEARLVVAKARVAPIKKVTVPKLELTAVLLSARLIKFTLDAYAGIFQFDNLYVWSDSKIALSWIHSSKVLPVYVSNRTDEIRTLIPTSHFRYVSTKDNPSDLITRGISAQQLLSSSAWWQGPSWLISPSIWPHDDREYVSDSSCLLQETLVCSSHVDTVPRNGLLDWERYGSYDCIVRILAWIYRFANNLRARGNTDGTCLSEGSKVLRLNELANAEKCLIRLAQKESYPIEHDLLTRDIQTNPTNLMRQLGLFMEGGLIRCKGRIHNADVDESTKFPILLSSSHLVTQHLIRKCHELCLHYGVNYVLAYMRRRWWIPKMRQAIKRIHTKCLVCKRLQGKPYSSVNVPPLPDFRVQRTDPFQVTGVDFTGAIQARGQHGINVKVYAVLYTCAVTRAIHIELIDTLSCEGFLHTLRRFVSRNGFPQIILSDNATNFVGASKYITDLMEDPQVESALARKGCQWRFIPARAPWFGAIWERTIGIVKSALKKVLGRALVSVGELQTILLEIEMAVNDRPLTYTSTSLDDPLPISPSMLTRGRQLNPFPTSSVTEGDLTDPTFCDSDNMKRRFQHVTKISNDLWNRWTQDYLLSLRERHSNLLKASPRYWPNVGDIVLIHDAGPRLCWKLGRIMELLQGADGNVRVVRLKTAAGITTRPVAKLYPLEQDLETDLDTSHDLSLQPSIDHASTNPTPQASGDARPQRKTALGSKALWRSKIATGDL